MGEHWYDETVIYCLDVQLFADSNGDGIGDLRGLIGRLDYLSRLGVTCLWLNPIHPSPSRDDGYDVTDYYGVDPRLGTLGDFVELVHKAGNLGLRVIIDLVINHTSDQHPWFQTRPSRPTRRTATGTCGRPDQPTGTTQAWCSRASRTRHGRTTGRRDAWYHHRFYDFQPDLNIGQPRCPGRDREDHRASGCNSVCPGFASTPRRS